LGIVTTIQESLGVRLLAPDSADFPEFAVRVVVVAPGDTVELTRSPGARIGLVVVGQGGESRGRPYGPRSPDRQLETLLQHATEDLWAYP